MEAIVRPEERAQLAACFKGLLPTFRSKLYAVVRDILMDFAVLVAFRLCMANKYD